MLGEYIADHILQLYIDVAFPPPPPPGGYIHSFSDEEINKIKVRYRELIKKIRSIYKCTLNEGNTNTE